MSTFKALKPRVRNYVALIVAIGTATIALSIRDLVANPTGSEWLLLAALTILTGSFSVKVSSINAYISVSETFVFVSVLLYGTAAGTITVLLECLVILLWMKPQGRPLHRMLFNLAAPSVAIWISGSVFYWLSGIQPYSIAVTPLPRLFAPLLAFTALYFLLNSWLVAIAVGLENSRSSLSIWWSNFAWLSVNYFSGASVAALIVTYTRTLELSTLAVIVPLLLVSYLTFRTAMGRAEDSYTHLAELNRLYLSTIETLAMAIDAKDQITHGHIRRVQSFAVGLAKQIGVADERLLKAIEAAALLHDMGKIAVPEHILNKPGKLTAAEFDKMKLHASVGADILSAIEFPYPVVPIVRHHHENWNGSGYPAGLQGTDIPIGARILSVVDCFDALTSDRPYRPRLSDEQAIDILLQRRGSMYDPLVVDTFIRVYKSISPTDEILSEEAQAFKDLIIASGRMRGGDAGPPADSVPAAIDLIANEFAIVSGLSSVGDVINKRLRRIIEFDLLVVYLYDSSSDTIVARYIIGDDRAIIKNLRFSTGDRLSGWVAANLKSIVNSDPALDLGELAKEFTPRLNVAMAAPLVWDGTQVGAIALYSAKNAFTIDESSALERVAPAIAGAISRGLSQKPVRDPLTGLRSSSCLSDLVRGSVASPATTALFVDIVGLSSINATLGIAGGDQVLLHVARVLTEALEPAEIFRHHDDEFVVAWGDDRSPSEAARVIRKAIRSNPFYGIDGKYVDVRVSVHSISHRSIDALLARIVDM